MIAGSIARRYARALLDIGQASRSSDAIGRELERITGLLTGSRELGTVLENPVFPLSKRRAILDEVSRRLMLSRVVKNFLMLLLDRGRMTTLADITREHRALVDESAGRVRAVVTSARPLEPGQETRIKTALEKKTGKVVLLDKRVDPALLGGVVSQIGDLVYDGSVRTQLATLRHELTGA